MSEIAVSVNGLTKKFKIYDNFFTDRLKEVLCFWKAQQYFSYFTALNEVNFEITQGQTVGLVGPNGSGKTTLLKILSGISFPTSGQVTVNGRVKAILALGLGFNPRFTGRENIEVGGCLLGMSRREVRRLESWIIEFSELGAYIDKPIRTYSTGMQARLAFSVATASVSDVLIVDEALATGDAQFVHKSLRRIHELCNQGSTAIFVSHNMHQIQRLCQRVMLIEQGELVADGDARNIIPQYEQAVLRYRQITDQRKKMINTLGGIVPISKVDFHAEKSNRPVGNLAVELLEVYCQGPTGEKMPIHQTGNAVDFILIYRCKENISNARVLLRFDNGFGQLTYVFQSDRFFDAQTESLTSKTIEFKCGVGKLTLSFRPLLFTTGVYRLMVTIYNFDELFDPNSDASSQLIYRRHNILEFEVKKPGDMHEGLVYENPVIVDNCQMSVD